MSILVTAHKNCMDGLAALVELVFVPYLIIRWVWYKLIIKAGKAAFIKENNENT